MASIQPRFTNGPRTYEAVEALDGGFVVEARAGGVDNPGVGVAGDASTTVIGVAQKAASPGGADEQRTPEAGVLDVTMAPREVAVINDGHVPLKYAAACAYGAQVVSAGAGSVRPAAGSAEALAVIGRCVEKGGVALGGVGLTRINL